MRLLGRQQAPRPRATLRAEGRSASPTEPVGSVSPGPPRWQCGDVAAGAPGREPRAAAPAQPRPSPATSTCTAPHSPAASPPLLPRPPTRMPAPQPRLLKSRKAQMTTKAITVTLAGVGGGWAQDGSVGDGDTVVASALSRGWLCPGPTPLTPQLLAQRLSSPARHPGRKGTSWALSPPSVQRGPRGSLQAAAQALTRHPGLWFLPSMNAHLLLPSAFLEGFSKVGR